MRSSTRALSPLLVAAICIFNLGVCWLPTLLGLRLAPPPCCHRRHLCLWMIEVILKYKSFTPFYATVLWYLYYVPMTLIPLVYQLCGLRLAGLEQHRMGASGTAPFVGHGCPAYRLCAY